MFLKYGVKILKIIIYNFITTLSRKEPCRKQIAVRRKYRTRARQFACARSAGQHRQHSTMRGGRSFGSDGASHERHIVRCANGADQLREMSKDSGRCHSYRTRACIGMFAPLCGRNGIGSPSHKQCVHTDGSGKRSKFFSCSGSIFFYCVSQRFIAVTPILIQTNSYLKVLSNPIFHRLSETLFYMEGFRFL